MQDLFLSSNTRLYAHAYLNRSLCALIFLHMTQTPVSQSLLVLRDTATVSPATVRNPQTLTIHVCDHWTYQWSVSSDTASLDNISIRKGEETRVISPENNFNSFDYFSCSGIGSQQKIPGVSNGSGAETTFEAKKNHDLRPS